MEGFVGLWTEEAELLWGPEAACGLEVERGTPSTPLPGMFSVPASEALAGVVLGGGSGHRHGRRAGEGGRVDTMSDCCLSPKIPRGHSLIAAGRP